MYAPSFDWTNYTSANFRNLMYAPSFDWTNYISFKFWDFMYAPSFDWTNYISANFWNFMYAPSFDGTNYTSAKFWNFMYAPSFHWRNYTSAHFWNFMYAPSFDWTKYMSIAPEPCLVLQGRGCQVEIQYRNVMVCASLSKIRDHEHAFSEANVAWLWSIATLPEIARHQLQLPQTQYHII
jgi:hypothetical protein